MTLAPAVGPGTATFRTPYPGLTAGATGLTPAHAGSRLCEPLPAAGLLPPAQVQARDACTSAGRSATRPSPLAPRPSPLAPRPSSLALRPSPLA
jgi:hypothetical protein